MVAIFLLRAYMREPRLVGQFGARDPYVTYLLGPKRTSVVEESGELGNGPAVSCGDHEDVAVVLDQGLAGCERMIGLGRGVQLRQDVLGESLGASDH